MKILLSLVFACFSFQLFATNSPQKPIFLHSSSFIDLKNAHTKKIILDLHYSGPISNVCSLKLVSNVPISHRESFEFFRQIKVTYDIGHGPRMEALLKTVQGALVYTISDSNDSLYINRIEILADDDLDELVKKFLGVEANKKDAVVGFVTRPCEKKD